MENPKMELRPARSITELEERSQSEAKFQFSLGHLILLSNVAGLVLAVSVLSPEHILAGGVLVGFGAPVLVMMYIFFCVVTRRYFIQNDRDLFSRYRKKQTSPFDD